MKLNILTSLIICLVATSCAFEDRDRLSELEDQISSLETELNEANEKITEYEEKFDNIQSYANEGYDAITYFNWSYQLQEALDAFENIESEAIY